MACVSVHYFQHHPVMIWKIVVLQNRTVRLMTDNSFNSHILPSCININQWIWVTHFECRRALWEIWSISLLGMHGFGPSPYDQAVNFIVCYPLTRGKLSFIPDFVKARTRPLSKNRNRKKIHQSTLITRRRWPHRVYDRYRCRHWCSSSDISSRCV